MPRRAFAGLSAAAVARLAAGLSVATASIDVLLYVSEPGRAVFGLPSRVTTQSFDPRQAVNTGSTRRLGNYQALIAVRDVFHALWTDTRTATHSSSPRRNRH